MTTWLHRILAPRRGRTGPSDPEAAEALAAAQAEAAEAAQLLTEAQQAGRFQRLTRQENNFGRYLDGLMKGTA